MTQIKREQLIELFKKAQFTDSNYSQGQITVDSPALVQNLQLAFEEADTGWHQVSLEPIRINQTYRFQYEGTISSTFGHVFKKVDGFLQNQYFRGKSEKKYYIIELNFDKNDSVKHVVIQQYEKLLLLINVMKEAAVFVDSFNSKMLFLNDKEQLELEPIYNKSDLECLQQDRIDQIIRFINDNTHKKQKLAILSKAIIAECGSESFDRRFAILLSNLDSLYKSLDHDYAVFASSFSYEKVQNEIENAKLEEQVKIHKVISDIQNQILGIPVATVIVATQFKTQKMVEQDFIYQFWVNTGIVAGVIIFAIFLAYLIENQKESLDAIELEINRKDKSFLEQAPIVYKKIKCENQGNPPFFVLTERIKKQKSIFCIIQCVSLIAVLVTIVFYCNMTVMPSFF